MSELEELSREELIVLARRLLEVNATLEEGVRQLERRITRNSGNSSMPPSSVERAGANLGTAAIRRDLGQLDAAESLAARAVRTYSEGPYRRFHTIAELLRAEIHIRAGEPHGLALAHQAIEAVSTLHSLAARREWLTPLATALEARPGTDAQELARRARQIATTPI